MQKSILSLLLLCLFTAVQGQLNPKIPFSLYPGIQKRSTEEITLLVEAETKAIQQFCRQGNCRIKYSYGDIQALTIAHRNIEKLAELEALVKIESPNRPVRALMDSSLIKNHIIPVHSGVGPLNGSYTGKGVVIGVIDFGIYFDHKDFQHGDSSTRIRYIWDQSIDNGSNIPIPYNYGDEWSWLDIDAGNCAHQELVQNFGHGTNVAGIAAGNGKANGKFKGVAPKSDLIIVSLDGSSFLQNVTDAIDYIFKKADALGKPCVINTSVGTYAGSHDAKDLYSQVIEGLLEERSGRSVVAAAGNAGNFPFHLGYDVKEDSAFTWFFENNPANPIFYEVYSDTADFRDVHFAFGADNPSLFFNYDISPWLNVMEDFSVTEGSPDVVVQSIYDQGNLLGQVWSRIEESNGVYKLEVQIFPVVNSLYWRFITKGEGRIDLWSSKSFTGSSNMVLGGLPSPGQMPDILTYKLPDTKQTMVSSWQCSPKVITVGNYVNRITYTDYNSSNHNVNSESGALPSVPDDLYPTSSFGPSRTGVVKPDVAATGSATLCTGNLDHISLLIGSGQAFKVAEGGLHNRNGGTSMASPVVAGIAALYLEKNPTADWNEIASVIRSTAFSDAFTGSLPNHKWGYGKVNAFDALTLNVSFGCTDTSSFNYDSSAIVDDGSCIPKVFGCTDSNAINYDMNANSDDGSCEYTTSIFDPSIDDNLIYPNPANEFLRLADRFTGAEVIIKNINGVIVFTGTHNDQSLDVSLLSPGVYYVYLKGKNYHLSSKFIKIR